MYHDKEKSNLGYFFIIKLEKIWNEVLLVIYASSNSMYILLFKNIQLHKLFSYKLWCDKIFRLCQNKLIT